MARRRSNRDDSIRRAKAILDGRIAVDVGQLMGAIHAVNPTGRAMRASERERRYDLKNSLQALLIERFGDELLVSRDPDDPRVVALARQRFPDDLTHAVIDDLADEARSWLRFQLDAARSVEIHGEGVAAGGHAGARSATATRNAEPTSPDALDRGTRDPRDLLAAGRAALEEYDYESAREAFERAVDVDPTPDAARALAELLVDHLGDDAAALACRDRLPPTACASPSVRSLLATAAARTGDVALGADLLAGVDPRDALGAWVELGRAAARRDDAPGITRSLAAIHDVDPSHPSLATLDEALAALRDRERPDLLAAARAALADGDLARARSILGDVLGRWPGDADAAGLDREVRSGQTAARIAEVRAHAKGASRRGDHRDAARAWQQVLGLDERDAEARASLGDALRGAKQQEERARTDRVVELLGAPERCRDGLERYLALPSARRGEVRGQRDLPQLTWVEAMGAADGPVARRSEAAAAAIAMERAMAAHDAGRAEEVVRLLADHIIWVRRVDDVRAVERAARRSLAERDARRFEVAIGQAERALRAGELDVARESGDRAGKVARRPAEGKRVRELEQQLAAAVEREQLADRYREAFDLGEVDAANRLLDRLEELTDGDEQERWRGERDRLRQRSRDSWTLGELDGPADGPRWWRPEAPEVRGMCRVLDVDGDSILLARLRGHVLFLTAIDVESGDVLQRRVLWMPAPVARLTLVALCQDALWLLGTHMVMMGIGRETGDVDRWSSVQTLAASGERIRGSDVTTDGTYLWIGVLRPEVPDSGRIRVFDLRRWVPVRELDEPGVAAPLTGDPAHRVAVISGDRQEISLFEPSGRLQAEPYWTMPSPAVAVTGGARPGGGDRVIALLRTPGATGPPSTTAVGCEPDGTTSRPVELAGIDPDADPAIVTARDLGLLFVSGGYRGGDRWVVALADRAGGLRELWRTRAPEGLVLVHSPDGRRVVALWWDRGEYHVRKLGTSLPEFPDGIAAATPSPVEMKSVAGCALAEGEHMAAARQLREELTSMDEKAMFRELLRRKTFDDADEVFRLALVHHDQGITESCRTEARDSIDEHPDHPGIAMLAADSAAATGDWRAVRELLEPFERAELAPDYARHLLHLLGVARAWTDDPDGASEAFELASIHPGTCRLAGWRDLFEDDADDGGDEADSVIQILATAVGAADECLDLDDAVGAIHALDRPEVWSSLELQSFARLADPMIRLDPGDEEQWYATALAAATFVELFESRPHRLGRPDVGGELPFPGHILDDEKLAALATRCSEWLESANEHLAEIRSARRAEGAPDTR